MSRGVIISRAHRDALYESFLMLLSQVGDLESFAESSEDDAIATCERVGRRLTAIFRLIQEGPLGWGYPQDEGSVTMTMDRGELARILSELRGLFVESQEATRSQREEAESAWKLSQEAREACTAMLEQLAGRA